MSQATVTADQVTPIDEFVTECYDRVEAWENTLSERGARYDEFIAMRGEDAADAYVAFFADLRLHLAALEEPAKIVGRTYEPADLLVDLRHLRDVTKTSINRRGVGMARRLSLPRAKVRWGVEVDETATQVTGQTYQSITDDLAARLARAIKASAR